MEFLIISSKEERKMEKGMLKAESIHKEKENKSPI